MPPFSDLHIHSSCSDGMLTPQNLVRAAAEKGLAAIALTDHDTMAGVAEAKRWADRAGIGFLPGIEFSVRHQSLSVHLLGYFATTACPALEPVIADVQHNRVARNRAIFERLAELGIKVDKKMLPDTENGQIGRPHIARLLVNCGAVTSEQEAFARFLRKGARAFVPRKALPVEEAIDAIHRGGGIAVAAHPGVMGLSEHSLASVLEAFIDMGLDGVEAYHPMHSRKTVSFLRAFALEKGLCVTGGSDFHGRGRDRAEMGEYARGRRILYEYYLGCLERLEQRSESA